MNLTIKNLSAFLSSVHFEVTDDADRLIYRIKEKSSSSGMALVRLTKFRTLFSLRLEILGPDSELKFILSRDRGLVLSNYKLLLPDGGVKFSFAERRKGLLFQRGEIFDECGNLIAYCPPMSFGPRGAKSGVIKDLQDHEIANYEWKGFSFTRGYRECAVILREKDENWLLCSVVAALIKGLSLQNR